MSAAPRTCVVRISGRETIPGGIGPGVGGAEQKAANSGASRRICAAKEVEQALGLLSRVSGFGVLFAVGCQKYPGVEPGRSGVQFEAASLAPKSF